MGFQTQVNLTPALAVAGDFASSNPRASVLAGEGGLVAGTGGLTVGKFAWIASDGKSAVNYGTATQAPNGFVHREQQALITTYLAESGNVIPAGMACTLMNEGDFYAVLTGDNAAVIGSAIYADYDTGDVQAVAGAGGASATGAIGATFTATGTGTSLVVTSVTGLISIGDTISGTGVPANTTIVAQVSGTTGGAGTYTTSAATTASSATVTAFGDVLNISAVASGEIKLGNPVSGTGVPAGAVISGLITGNGGTGTYRISVRDTSYTASTAITVTGGVLTAFKAQSVAAVGELVKISTWG
jgi:hypothetical protein